MEIITQSKPILLLMKRKEIQIIYKEDLRRT